MVVEGSSRAIASVFSQILDTFIGRWEEIRLGWGKGKTTEGLFIYPLAVFL